MPLRRLAVSGWRRFSRALYPKGRPMVRIPASPLFLSASPLLEPIDEHTKGIVLTVPFPHEFAHNRYIWLKSGTNESIYLAEDRDQH
jgi:hypothetical protein